MRVATPAIDTSSVDAATAAAIEAAEADAWADMFAAAPAGFAASAGVSARKVDGALAISWRASERRYFSRAIGLGVVEPATPSGLDEIVRGYADEGIEMFLISSQPHCGPPEFEEWLARRGFTRFDAQDRVVRDGSPLKQRALATDRELRVEQVTGDTADEWAAFVQRVYRLDTGGWLQALVERPRWYQYVVRERGEIVAARGMHLTQPQVAWVGMDGPVPGLGTRDFEPDVALWERIVEDGVAAGARMFIADIEAPSPSCDTPAYDYFARLGFSRPYTRTHWTRRDVGSPA